MSGIRTFLKSAMAVFIFTFVVLLLLFTGYPGIAVSTTIGLLTIPLMLVMAFSR